MEMKKMTLEDWIGAIIFAGILVFLLVSFAYADEYVLGAFDSRTGKCVSFGTFDYTHAEDKILIIPADVTDADVRFIDSIEECKAEMKNA